MAQENKSSVLSPVSQISISHLNQKPACYFHYRCGCLWSKRYKALTSTGKETQAGPVVHAATNPLYSTNGRPEEDKCESIIVKQESISEHILY